MTKKRIVTHPRIVNVFVVNRHWNYGNSGIGGNFKTAVFERFRQRSFVGSAFREKYHGNSAVYRLFDFVHGCKKALQFGAGNKNSVSDFCSRLQKGPLL